MGVRVTPQRSSPWCGSSFPFHGKGGFNKHDASVSTLFFLETKTDRQLEYPRQARERPDALRLLQLQRPNKTFPLLDSPPGPLIAPAQLKPRFGHIPRLPLRERVERALRIRDFGRSGREVRAGEEDRRANVGQVERERLDKRRPRFFGEVEGRVEESKLEIELSAPGSADGETRGGDAPGPTRRGHRDRVTRPPGSHLSSRRVGPRAGRKRLS